MADRIDRDKAEIRTPCIVSGERQHPTPNPYRAQGIEGRDV